MIKTELDRPDFEPKARKLIPILGAMNDGANTSRLKLELETAYNQGCADKTEEYVIDLEAALTMLISLKEEKDRNGKNAAYEYNKTLAWERAKDVLNIKEGAL